MSKSLKRVARAAETLNLDIEIREMTQSTRTAADAAGALGCDVEQIAKSIILQGLDSASAFLFLTSGANQVDVEKAARVVGEPLGKADAALIRDQTGFAIGGVAPIGHLNPIRSFCDPHLTELPLLWAAAGTPRHLFSITPEALLAASGARVADFVRD